MVRKAISLLLIFCLVAGMIPTMAMAAEVSLTLSPDTIKTPDVWNDFKQQISSAQQDDVVTIKVTEKTGGRFFCLDDFLKMC